MPRARIAASTLAGWTLFVWTTRIGNIWNDDAASTASKVGSTALALSFTVLAVAVVVAGVHANRSSWPPIGTTRLHPVHTRLSMNTQLRRWMAVGP